MISGVEGNFQYVRTSTSIEPNNQFTEPPLTAASSLSTPRPSDSTTINDPPIITLPITMPGLKPGDAQQTVHIQVMNPNALQTTKFQMGQIPTMPSFQPNSTTVLTVAYNPNDGKFISNGLSQGMTVVAAIQPQDLQILAQAQHQIQIQQQQHPFMHHHHQDQIGLQNVESLIMQNIANEPLEDTKCEAHM